MRVAICDDHLTFSEALEGLLSARGHEVVRRAPAPDRPDLGDGVDVCVLDLQFPGVNGCDAVEVVRAGAPTTPIVVLTCRERNRRRSLESVLAQVVEARASNDRRRFRSRQVQALEKRSRGGRAVALTPREAEILRALADGMTTAEMARTLGIEVATVRTHVQHLFGKFGAHSRLELVAAAIRMGIGDITPRSDDRLPQTS